MSFAPRSLAFQIQCVKRWERLAYIRTGHDDHLGIFQVAVVVGSTIQAEGLFVPCASADHTQACHCNPGFLF
jgi:hypothetical protein